MDITKYPEGPREIIKYMNFMPQDEQARMKLLMAFMNKVTMG